ncbi:MULTISPECIES: cytochrome P450 [unclassified Streptomyces]|uniref:cytochrome P450 n=1 Tax=unclassified Streptomyces TaxID=2593676 RepID=UPI00202E6F70|nr:MULTISPECIES: cytochrome P450 [unclassified Streptomyces]MCM1972169.1 cytochrome P450 [Streptomyces sp. G1]MCX5129558.1 cytochrome P450 [Streptomyces sp. NBC_00347]
MLPTGEIDLLEDTWAREVPHAQFTRLRREDPVHWHEVPGRHAGFYAVTRHADVKAVSRDPELWSTELGSFMIRDQNPESLETLRLVLLGMDAPRHSRYRSLVSAGFTPRVVRRLAARIQERAVTLVERAVTPGRDMDFVAEVAAWLPIQTICEMVGVPEGDERLIFEWSNRMAGSQDPELSAGKHDSDMAAAEIYAYCDALAAERRARPREDILSTLVHAEVDGDRLSPDEINMFFVLLCVAGNETTRNLLSGALIALIDHPSARAELAAAPEDEALWTTATEEFLRWGGSIHNFRRTATRDTVLRGRPVAEGQKVVTYYTSANRDEEVFADPFAFDIRRTPNEHLTFGGGGPHFCLGAGLARTQIKALVRELLRRHPEVSLSGEVRRLRSDFINGVKYLPVRFG